MLSQMQKPIFWENLSDAGNYTDDDNSDKDRVIVFI